MKSKDFKEWMLGLEKLTRAQRDKLLDEVEGMYFDPMEGQWRDRDSPTTEFRAMTSFNR